MASLSILVAVGCANHSATATISDHERAAETPTLDAGTVVESVEAAALVKQLRADFLSKMDLPISPSHPTPQPMPLIGDAQAPLLRDGATFKTADDLVAESPSHGARVTLPANGRQAFRLTDSDSGAFVDVALASAPAAEAEVGGGLVVYRATKASEPNVLHRVSAEGTEDFVHYAVAPDNEEADYDLTLGDSIAGVRLVAGVVELVDGKGFPRVHMGRPWIQSQDSTRQDADVSITGCAIDTNPDAPWDHAVVSPGARSCRVRIVWSARGVSYPALLDPAWHSSASMTAARAFHTATTLSNGTVLLAGGMNGSLTSGLTSAELYNPTAHVFAATGSMSHGHVAHVAGYFSYPGAVIVAGGSNESSIEVYQNGIWRLTGNLSSARAFAAIAPVNKIGNSVANGSPLSLLVCGGYSSGVTPASTLKSCDAISAAGTVAVPAPPSMSQPRALFAFDSSAQSQWPTAIGGVNASGVVASLEQLYLQYATSVSGGTWQLTSNAALSRYSFALAQSGNVEYLLGGFSSSDLSSIASATSGSINWTASAGTLSVARDYLDAAVASDGSVVIIGGDGSAGAVATTDILRTNGTVIAGPNLQTARYGHRAIAVADGILVTGGSNTAPLSSVELYKLDFTNGQSCKYASDCASNICQNSVCCSAVCNACQACDATGTCKPISLDDQNPCTVDSCDPVKGPSHVAAASGTSCSDGNACNGAETCNATAKCLVGTPPQIAAGNPCGSGLCDPVKNAAAVGDFNGDGKADLAILTDLGNNSSAIYLMFSTGTGFTTPSLAWSATNWSYAATSWPAVGDFDGDGKTDLVFLYDYGNSDAGLEVTQATTGGLAMVERWRSGAGNFNGATARLVTGDYNGDGLLDVGALYQSGPWVKRGNPLPTLSSSLDVWLRQPTYVPQWFSQSDLWDGSVTYWTWSATQLASGSFLTVPSSTQPTNDFIASYDSNNQTTLYRFDSSDWTPTAVWSSATVTKALAKMVRGDFTGDGLTDLLFQQYDASHYTLSMLAGPQATTSTLQSWYTTTAGPFDVGEWQPLAGDFNGDGKLDLAMVVTKPDHSDNGVWLQLSNGTSFAAPIQFWKSAAGTPATPPFLDDGNACTVKSCDFYKGVIKTPSAAGIVCTDGNRCHATSLCDGSGNCPAGAAISVDDGNACTTDSCNPTSGPVHTPVAAGTSCGANCMTCNSTGVCNGCASGTACVNATCEGTSGHTCSSAGQCASGFCVTGVCCSSACTGPCQTCGANGTCIGCASGQICGPSNQCLPGSCSATAPCVAGYFCSAGNVCEPRLPNGATGTASSCASGFAVDGVCCDRACTGGCERCDLPGAVGTCGSALPGTIGRATCAGNFVCSGAAGCTTTCTTDAQCANSYYCSGGSCTAKVGRAGGCTNDAQCGSGFCVDNVCCDSRCNGVDDSSGTPAGCTSCAIAGHVGTCTAAAIGSCANVPPFTPTPIPAGLSSSFVNITSFLYNGGTQNMPDGSALAAGTIRNDRGAVVRGRVSQSGLPLPGATVSVRNHPEYGRTFSRTDGQYDLAVNGGESLVVQVTAPNHPDAARQVFVPPLAYASAADITMVPYAAAQTVDLTSAASYHAVQSQLIGSGTSARQVSVLFPGGARVRMHLSSGNVDLTQPTLRITEFTQADTDLAAMPASLPATSAYTFCADFFVEPPAGVTETPSAITFVDSSGNAISLPAYVDNFLGFPVGTTAPLGGYDPTNAYWQASPSGKIIRILSVTSGVASIDDVGDGAAHDADLPLGERQLLGQLYPTAQKRDFMRVLLPHFSHWDINQGQAPPPNASFPPNNTPTVAGNATDQQTCRAGSIIECQAQTLSEQVPLAGTSFSLVYRSDRQIGYSARRTVNIPITPSMVPSIALGVQVEMTIAGQVVEQYFPAGTVPSNGITVTWNGLDGYGRAVAGEFEAQVHYAFVYGAVYGNTSVFGYNGGGQITTLQGTTIPTREPIALWSPWYTVWLASYDARSVGLRGWTLSAQHNYDVQRGVLYPGDGRARHVSARMPWEIDTLVGGPNAIQTSLASSQLSGLAVSHGAVYFTRSPTAQPTSLWELRDGVLRAVTLTSAGSAFAIPNYNGALVSDRDGNLLLSVNGIVYRIALTQSTNSTSGVVTIYAGTGACWATTLDKGDGGLATSAKLCDVRAIAPGQDGSLFIAEGSRGDIRRVAPSGTITTIFGPDSINPNTVNTSGQGVNAVAGSADGSLYFVQNNAFIQRITAEGLLLPITASSGSGDDSDGAPAITARLGYFGDGMLWVASDGSIYFSQNGGAMLRRVRTDGTLETVGGVAAGTGSYGGDGGTAIGPTIGQATAFAEGPLGELIIIDGRGPAGVRHIAAPRPNQLNASVYVPSSDASEIYVFDSTGRHQLTLDALTGAQRLAFTYRADGTLATVQEFVSTTGVPLVTTIDNSSEPIVITGPFGHKTQLYKDTNGYGSVIADPTTASTGFGFSTSGFMTSEIDARGNEHAFGADALGRLIRDADPAGGVQTFTLDASGTTVNVTTAEGTPAQHQEIDSAGSVTQIDRFQSSPTDITALMSTTTIASSGGTNSASSDGSSMQSQPCTDPRFGVQAELTCAMTTTTDGVTAQSSLVSVQQCAASDCGAPVACDATNLTLLRKRTDQYTVNGQLFTSQYDRCPNGTLAPTETFTTAAKRAWTVGYDSSGNVISQAIVDTRPTATYPVNYHYRTDGRIDTITQGNRLLTLAYNPTSTSGNSGALSAITTSNSDGSDSHQTLFDGYDAAERLLHSTLPGNRPLALGRDLAGNVNSITTPGKTAHLMPRDGLDRVAQYQPPAVTVPTTSTYQYDRDRRLRQVANPGDNAISLSYDARGRVQTVSHPSRTLTFTYEKGVAGINGGPPTLGLGRLSSIADQTGAVLSYGYGATGSLPLSQTWSGGIVSGTVAHTIDANHQLLTESVNGQSLGFAHDPDGALTQAGAMTLVPDPVNRALLTTTLGIVSDQRTYNRYGEAATYSVTAAGKTIYSATYDDFAGGNANPRDNLGRIKRKSESIFNSATGNLDTVVKQYAYDSAGRLWRVLDTNGNVTEDYEYDANGNRTSATVNGVAVTNIQVDAQDRLLTYGATTLTYTPSGQRQTMARNGITTTYSWDGFGNLMSVSWPSTKIEYQYDAQQRRVARKKWNTATTTPTLLTEEHYLYGDQYRVVATLDGTYNVLSRYVYGTHINVPDYVATGQSTYRVIVDERGSVRQLVDVSTGAVNLRLDYADAFGTPTANASVSSAVYFGFAGGLTDSDIGLVHFGARDYDPSTGEWLSKDPLSFDGGDSNLYAFVLNDPINYVDPSGTVVLPADPYALPPSWTVYPDPFAPNRVVALDSSGFRMVFDRAGPNQGNRGDHWHIESSPYNPKYHFAPGTNIPDRFCGGSDPDYGLNLIYLADYDEGQLPAGEPIVNPLGKSMPVLPLIVGPNPIANPLPAGFFNFGFEPGFAL